MREPDKLLPTLVGFAALALCFYRSKSIILSTLLGATAFGVTLKLLMLFGRADAAPIVWLHFGVFRRHIFTNTDK